MPGGMALIDLISSSTHRQDINMQNKKSSSERFENARLISIVYFVVILILILMGISIPGLWKKYYLLILQLLGGIYLMIPGLTMFTHPWISQAWLNALHSRLVPNTSWDELTGETRALIFIGSSITLLAGSLILILSILTL